MWVFLALFAWPLVEIGLFVEIGGRLGVWTTLGLVLASALAGMLVLRSQGARAQAGLRAAMEGLGNPAVPLAHEALILLAGMLLILPGFFTDFIGLALLLPPVRGLVIARFSRRIVVHDLGAAHRPPPHAAGQGKVIEGEFLEIDSKNPPRRGHSGWTDH